ncbi:hypothetical protein HY374_03565 [Candidatus Berkelbacteria bacterium]|nr:hypothetical protein [Candidatus Berkelbacteria bacterium]
MSVEAKHRPPIAIQISGNTLGESGPHVVGTLRLAGGNNLTLSQTGSSITFSVFNQSQESHTLGMSNLGNSSGTSGMATGPQVQFLLAGGNNVTLSQSLSGASATITISAAAQTVESQTVGMSNLGNTSGTSGVASGGQIRLLLAGGNSVTLSQSIDGASATVTILAGDYLTTAMASNRGTDFVQATAAFAGTSASGTIASGGISINIGPYLTTAALSGDTSKYAGINGAITGGSLTVNTSGISINLPAYLTTAMQSASSSVFAKTGFTTASTAGSDIVGTLNTDGLSMGIPKYLTTAALSAATSNYAGVGETVGTTAGTDLALTVNTDGVSIGYPKWITTAALSGDTTKYAGVGESSGTQAGTDFNFTMNTDGLSLLYPKVLTTAALSGDTSKYAQSWELEGAQTAGTTGSAHGATWYLSGGNNITLSGNSNTIVISAAAGGAGTVSSATTVSSVATANAVGADAGRYALEGHQHGGVPTVSLVGNTAGQTTQGNMSLVLAGGPNITLSGGTAAGIMTVSISAPAAGGGAAPTLDIFLNFDLGAGSAQHFGTSQLSGRTASVIVQPLMGNYDVFPGNITANTAYLKLSISRGSTRSTAAFTNSAFLGVYTQNVSTLSLLNSVVVTWGNAAATNNSTIDVGIRWLTIHSSAWSVQPTFGQSHYYWGLLLRTSGVSNDTLIALGNTIWGSATATASGTIGVATVASATSLGMAPWYGVYSGATSSLPGSIGSNQLNKITDVAIFNPLLMLLRTGPQTF